MSELPFPLAGTTLIVGPSQAGKTHLTARALDTWVERHGSQGVVVLEFAPELKRGNRLLGGRLNRFTDVPDRAWHGILDAHAPRAEGANDEEALELARDNAKRAGKILDAAPDPCSVFVNDATIPLQHEVFPPASLTTYCDRAECGVLNAFESDELGSEDNVSQQERSALATLRSWADRTFPLEWPE